MTDTVMPSYKAAPVSYGEDFYQQGIIWHISVIFLVILLKVFIYDKTVISNTSYNLDEEGVTVKTGLFNITTKSFRYLDIVSIQHQQNFIEASSGVGTTTIRTPSEDAIKLKQLPSHMEIFELIQSKRKGNL